MSSLPDLPWTRDELVLALSLFEREGARPAAAHLWALGRELRSLSIHPAEARPSNFRSSDAVGMMLAQFGALKTKQASSRGISQGASAVWAEFTAPGGFGRDHRRLAEAARDVRARHAPPAGGA